MPNLNELASANHPYYCSDHNYYSNDASWTWSTMTEFLDEMEDADIDMNLVFRWDVHETSKDNVSEERIYLYGKFHAEVFIMHQRKGKFAPNLIYSITEEEVPRFIAYLDKHWETLSMLWSPINEL